MPRRAPGPVTPLTGLLVAAAVAGVVLRALAVTGRLGALDSDEGVTGLMARAVLRGELTAFWWGQPYGGTAEAILTAPAVWLLGSGTAAVRLVPVALWVAAAVVTWRLGRATVGEPAARIGAALLWVWPAYGAWKSTRAHGYYGVLLLCGVLVLLLAARARERGRWRDVAALGLVVGVGWWTSPQIALVAVPALLWLVWRRPSLLRRAHALLAGLVLGALPWLAWNLANDWGSFRLAPAGGTFLSRLRGLGTATLPMITGVRAPLSRDWPVGRIAAVLLLALLAVAVARLLLRHRRERGLELLAVVLVVFPLPYAASGFTWLTDEPRYLVLVAPVLSLLVGRVLADGGTALVGAGLAAAVVLGVLGLRSMERAPGPLAPDVPVPADVGPLIRALDARGIRAAEADYWIAYRVTYLTGERIVVVPAPRTGVDRWAPFAREVAAAPCRTRVTVAGSSTDRALAAADRWRERLLAGGFAVHTTCVRG